MSSRLSHRFLFNYLIMFVMSLVVAACAFLLMGFAGDMMSKTLKKNNHTAQSLMQHSFAQIDAAPVVENGGGVQVVDENLHIVLSEGIDTFGKQALTMTEFTEFLALSQSRGVPYSFSIEYNETGRFWLIVTFPTSVRIDFAIVHNTQYPSADTEAVTTVIISVAIFYLLLLGAVTVIYSKISSIGIVTPLRKLCQSVSSVKDGDYSVRADLHLKNEFKELQDAFNAMAERIEQETALRRQAEENRKKLVLDISHDLKTPLAGIMGYAELCLDSDDITDEQRRAYLNTIYKNSVRANNLIVDMFELSRMESTAFVLNQTRVDICEYLREEIGALLPALEQAGFEYSFDIPDIQIYAAIDVKHFGRVIQNLVSNTIKFNPQKTTVRIALTDTDKHIRVIFSDNGVGIPAELAAHIFEPFVRADSTRTSSEGGTGLGLAIVQKIVVAHGGSITLVTDTDKGCTFTIQLPKI